MASTSSSHVAPNLPLVEGTEPHRCILDAFRTSIAQRLTVVFPTLTLEKAYEGVDYSKKDSDFTVALPRFRLPGKPADGAKLFAEKFEPDEWVDRVEIVGSGGFLLFWCRTETLASRVLGQIDELTNRSESGKPEYGHSDVGKGKKLILEYSSPNIAKEFHVGHLRSTIIGAFLSNLYRSCGWDVVSLNYLGDWGKQFGLIAVGYDKYGDEEEMERDPIKHLYNVYVKINKDLSAEKEALGVAGGKKDYKAATQEESVGAAPEEDQNLEEPAVESEVDKAARAYFARMESGDESSLKNWRKWREYSIQQYEKQYETLGVRFDEYVGESLVSRDTQLQVVKELEEKVVDKSLIPPPEKPKPKKGKDGKMEEAPPPPPEDGDVKLVSDVKGAKLVDLERWKLGKAILLKKDGTTMYLTRDIIGAMERWDKYHFDKMIYVVASQQDLHLAQFFKILQLMGLPWSDRLEHINFGMVTGMSTRKGTAVFLNTIIDESKNVMMEQMKKNEEKFNQIEDPDYVAREVGLTAIKVQDMQAKRVNNYAFNWSRMTSFEGDTGPYLQYAHVRLSSISRKNPNLVPLPPLSSIDFALLSEPKARDIIFLLGSYPDAVRTALKTREPSGIVTYCMKLSHAISAAWDVLLVKGEPDQDKAKARMWLFLLAREVLGAGMRLLSLTPLERM